MYAVRNIRLCTKDCLCLYTCPTGATDTETGQIDNTKCISGCRICVDACPSHAISLVPDNYPPQQPKTQEVLGELRALAKSKVEQDAIANELSQVGNSPVLKQFAKALAKSNGLMAEDIYREAGFMLAQSNNARELLLSLLDSGDEDFPVEVVNELLDLIKVNDAPKTNNKYRCSICGHIHEGEFLSDFKCPICSQPESMFELIKE